MNAFKILDKNGKALTMGELDKEAAEFWGKEVHPKHYANPFPDKKVGEGASYSEAVRIERENALNNAHIACQGDYTSGWQNVVHTMVVQSLGDCLVNLRRDKPIELAEFVGDTEIHLGNSWEEELYATLTYYKPFVDLINHWMAKGYIPVKVEE